MHPATVGRTTRGARPREPDHKPGRPPASRLVPARRPDRSP
ncbi:hypothetical protein ACFPM0_06080 [Pseudonocardia sulfidoxydans]